MAEQKTGEPRYTYRLPPCPSYDVEGTESWLSAMAEKGYVLAKDGFLFGFAAFEKAQPQKLRYRLQASQQPIGALSENTLPEDAEDLYASFGWRYVCARGQFHIFCTDSPDAPELNTDPRVQAIALDVVRKREWSNAVTTVLWVIIYPLISIKAGVLRTMLAFPTPLLLLTFTFLIWTLILCIRKIVSLRRVRKRLMQGEPLDHAKDWKRNALYYRLGHAAYPLLILALICCFLSAWSDDMQGKDKLPLEDFSGTLPFATIADFAPEGNYANREIGYSNTVSIVKRLLAPEAIKYNEYGSITLPDGSLITGGLQVEYYETVSPLLARAIAWEFEMAAKRTENYESYALEPLDVDYASGYMEYFPTIVLQNGCKVLCAMFYQTSESTMPYAQWVEVMAEGLKNGG